MRKTLLLFSLLMLSAVHAEERVIVQDAWVRAPGAGSQITAAYMTLRSGRTLTLAGASSPVAEFVEIHTMSMRDGVMEMRQIDGLKLPAGKPVTLKPGGLHLMLINLKKPLKAGEEIELVLDFKDGERLAGTQTVKAVVRAGGGGHAH